MLPAPTARCAVKDLKRRLGGGEQKTVRSLAVSRERGQILRQSCEKERLTSSQFVLTPLCPVETFLSRYRQLWGCCLPRAPRFSEVTAAGGGSV